jgi:outer membrane protein TolC
MKKIAILLLILWCSMVNLSADIITLDIDTAIEMAVENNLSLKVMEINYHSAKRKVRAVWNNVLPSVNLSTRLTASDQLFTDVQSAGTGTSSPWSFETSIGASLPLNTGLTGTIEQTELDYKTAHINYTTAKNELKRNIKKQFFYILALKEDIRLKKENIDLAQKRYIKAQSNFNNGLVPKLEVFSARVSYENQKPAYTQAKLDYQTQCLNFKKLIGLESTGDIELVGTLNIDFYTFDRDLIIRKWLNEIPNLQLKMNEIKQLEMNKAIAISSNLSPTLTLSGSWGTNIIDPFNSDSWHSGNWMDNVAFGISLSLPCDGFIPDSKKSMVIQEADDALLKARIELQELRLNIVNTISILLMQLETYREKIELSQLNTELAQQTYQMIEKSYKNGTSELLDVENAQQKLLSAHQDLLMAQYQYLSGLIDLESTLGKSLKDITKE